MKDPGILFSCPLPVLAGLHLILGVLFYWMPSAGLAYGVCAFAWGLWYIAKTNGQDTLVAVAYLAGAEVLLRMLGGTGYE